MKPLLPVSPEQTIEISLYNDTPAQPRVIAEQLAKLKSAFPAMEKEFISVLSERVAKNAISENRLKDAVGYLIDTFKYKQPSISDVIGYDRRIKLFNYKEVCSLVNKGEASFTDFHKHWIGDTLFRVLKSDCEQYLFKPRETKPTENLL